MEVENTPSQSPPPDEEIAPAVDLSVAMLKTLVDMVTRGEPIESALQQQFTQFLGNLQPKLDLMRVANASFQVSRLAKLAGLTSAAEAELARRLSSESIKTLETKELVKIMQMLYTAQSQSCEAITELATAPPASSPEKLAATTNTSQQAAALEHVTDPASRKQFVVLYEQMRNAIRRANAPIIDI